MLLYYWKLDCLYSVGPARPAS